jgi:hypothetical protein
MGEVEELKEKWLRVKIPFEVFCVAPRFHDLWTPRTGRKRFLKRQTKDFNSFDTFLIFSSLFFPSSSFGNGGSDENRFYFFLNNFSRFNSLQFRSLYPRLDSLHGGRLRNKNKLQARERKVRVFESTKGNP